MSHCPIRNHPRPLLIEDFEGIADDFLRFSLVVLPESREEIYLHHNARICYGQ